MGRKKKSLSKKAFETIQKEGFRVFTEKSMKTVGQGLLRNIEIISSIKRINKSNSITIFGTPRGGTTWLLEILMTVQSYKPVFEPLHKAWFPNFDKINLSPRPFIPPNADSPELHLYLSKILSGRIISQSTTYKSTFRDFSRNMFATNLVVKFVRANRLLPWFVNNFKVKGCYFLVRHPCATILSQLKTGYTGYTTSDGLSYIPSKELVLKEASEIPQLKGDEDLLKKIKDINTKEEILAAVWSLDNYVPLNYSNKKTWKTIAYENLIIDWQKEIEDLFNFIGEDAKEETYKMLERPSQLTTESEKSFLGSKKQLEKWKEQLSKKQIEDILRVTNWFGLNFYSEDIEPDYEFT